MTNHIGLIIMLDEKNNDLCISFNRAMRYRYETGYIATLSKYDDKTMFPPCAGSFARPSDKTVLQGISWLFKEAKDAVTIAVLGDASPAIVAGIKKAIDNCKKPTRITCIATSDKTFPITPKASLICGQPEVLLPQFDGSMVAPSKLKGVVCSGDFLYTPQAKPWCY